MAELIDHSYDGTVDGLPKIDFLRLNSESTLRDVNAALHREYPGENAFMYMNLSSLVKQALLFRHYLPRVQPYYAVKCHPDPVVLRTLYDLGVFFDCASEYEFNLAFAAGAKPSELIYAHPAKPFQHLAAAKKHGVRLMTFDNLDELKKIKIFFPEAEVVLRISSFDQNSKMPFSFKFGAPVPYALSLIQSCKDLELNLVGISFHVGSGCMSASAYEDTLAVVSKLFEAATKIGFNLSLVDIGGGFPGADSDISFAAIAPVVAECLEKYFPEEVTVIAEPGRYFVSAMALETLQVYARRPSIQVTEDGEHVETMQYYFGDGVYGNFNSIVFDHVTPEFFPLQEPKEPREILKTTFFGPTCDAQDCMMKSKAFPELHVGEWLFSPTLGAYTCASRSDFNGFAAPRKVYYVEDNFDIHRT